MRGNNLLVPVCSFGGGSFPNGQLSSSSSFFSCPCKHRSFWRHAWSSARLSPGAGWIVSVHQTPACEGCTLQVVWGVFIKNFDLLLNAMVSTASALADWGFWWILQVDQKYPKITRVYAYGECKLCCSSNSATKTHTHTCKRLRRYQIGRNWMKLNWKGPGCGSTVARITLRRWEPPYGPPIFCFKDGATLLPILTSLDSWGLLPKNLDKHRGLGETFSGQSHKSDQDHPKVCVRGHALDTEYEVADKSLNPTWLQVIDTPLDLQFSSTHLVIVL